LKERSILLLDATINLILGILLLLYSENLAAILGVPYTSNYFYPTILGAIFIGITIALFIEFFRKTKIIGGLGLGGAIAINLCGGIALALWLTFGNLQIPTKGQIFLWLLVILLVGISSIELYYNKNMV
jgi:hypothetical protein